MGRLWASALRGRVAPAALLSLASFLAQPECTAPPPPAPGQVGPGTVRSGLGLAAALAQLSCPDRNRHLAILIY